MMKIFTVEVEYDELAVNKENQSDVLYDEGIEVVMHELMQAYLKSKSIASFTSVSVTQEWED